MPPSQSQLARQVEILQEKAKTWSGNDNDESRESLREAALSIAAALEPPYEISDRLSFEPVTAMCLNVALDAGWLQALSKADKPMSALTLAELSGASEDFVIRIMRILTLGNVAEESGVTEYLANDMTHYAIGKAIFESTQFNYPIYARAFLEIPKWARDNKFQEPKGLMNGPLASAYKKTYWEVLEADQQANEAFVLSMDFFYDINKTKRDMEFVYEHLTQLGTLPSESNAITLVDVGGAVGTSAKTFRQLHPEITSRVISQDRPSVIEAAQKQPNPESIELQAHDFFTAQPVKGARAYSIRHVLHDWCDEDSRKILRNIASAMTTQSRLFIFEILVPDRDCNRMAAMMDMLMMSAFSGKERTRKQWGVLLASAGLELVEAHAYDDPFSEGAIVAALPELRN